MVICYIALGSNLGDRKKNIDFALKYLQEDPKIKFLNVSSFRETEPHQCPPQPDFLNAVAKLATQYSAYKLLKRLQAIEVKLGRKRSHPKNSPRVIDLDILLYGDLHLNRKDLKLPHPRMWQREFVTLPLQEIAPNLFR